MPATLTAASTLIGQPPRPARSRAAAAIIRMLWAPTVFGWIVLLPPAALADRTTVQDVPCEPGPERRLAVDGSVSACRLAAAADLLVDPAGGNGKVPCAAGSAVEFHRNGYLSFCEAAGAAASYRDRAGRETRCLAKARLAFGEGGYLEYCS
jgi:hypothetical protein